jgi:Protein of unknown function (DUF1350)
MANALQMASSPFRQNIDSAMNTLRMVAPDAAKLAEPLIEQLNPVFKDVAQGRQDFSPTPAEADRLIRSYYDVQRSLLIRFESDLIDETERLRAILEEQSEASSSADVTVRTLPGDHVRPMSANVVELPPEVARFADDAAKGSSEFIGVHTSLGHL